MQLRKCARRHVECGVDAVVVVVVDGAVDFGDELAERCEPIRVAELHFELVVEGLLVAVLPRTTFLRARDLDAAVREYLPEGNRVVLDAIVAVEDPRTWIVEERRPQRLDHEHCSVRRENGGAEDGARVHVHDGGEVDGRALPSDVGEIGDPRVVHARWRHDHEEIRVFDDLVLGFSPPSSSAPICLDAEEPHHPQDRPLIFPSKGGGNSPVSVRRMVSEHFFDRTFHLPVPLGLLLRVVQGRSCDSERTSPCALRERRAVHHFFFWVSESVSVILPTNRKSSSISRLSFARSRMLGTPCAFLPSQLYTVCSETPCSLATSATATPSFLMRLIICSFTSGGMRYFFIWHYSNE